jgi:uncharacterized protein (TIGR02646 family)
MIDVKNSKLEYFENFKKKNNAQNYIQDCDNFELKENIRKDLLKKQRNQCAYCERLLDINKQNFHIEHIEPRDNTKAKLECEYSNLVLSCNNDDSCGRYKGSRHLEDGFIHPVLDNPTLYFKFNEDGQILTTDLNANKTKDFLNLNNNKLIRVRKNIVLELYNMGDIEGIENYFFEFENLVKQYKNLNKNK